MSRKKRQPIAPMSAKVVLRPGWLIIDNSTASGGIRYDRHVIEDATTTINRGAGIETTHQTVKTVDHVEFCARIDALVKKVDYSLRKHGTRVGKNWFADDEALKVIEAEIAEIATEAARLNTLGAEEARSDRRAHIGIMPIPIDFDREEAVREIARTIRETMTEVLTALQAGAVDDFHKLKIRCMNLDKLAVGMQSDAIRFALERFAEAAKEIKTAANEARKKALASAAREADADKAAADAAAKLGRKLDLESIQVAIDHFQPSVFVTE